MLNLGASCDPELEALSGARSPSSSRSALQKLLLHQVELLRPDRVRALDGQRPGPFGDRLRDRRRLRPTAFDQAACTAASPAFGAATSRRRETPRRPGGARRGGSRRLRAGGADHRRDSPGRGIRTMSPARRLRQ